MKLRGHVTAVGRMGAFLCVEMLAAADSEPNGTDLRSLRIMIPDNKRNTEAFRVDRSVVLTLEVK